MGGCILLIFEFIKAILILLLFLSCKKNNLESKEINSDEHEINFKKKFLTQDSLLRHNFKHPGILLSTEQLQQIELKLKNQENPTYSAYLKILKSKLSALNYAAKAWPTVECGNYSNPNYGCSDEINDAKAAYTHALLWGVTAKTEHALKAIQILNEWSSVLKGKHKNNNAALQASWAAQLWTRTAEIIRSTASDLWPLAEQKLFNLFLAQQYLPDILNMGTCHVMNWKVSRLEALLNIAIFSENQSLFNYALTESRALIKSSIFLESDGEIPIRDNNCKSNISMQKLWYYPSKFISGLTQETCRDLAHTGYGLAAFVNIAETAYIQGIDLYSEFETRLISALEYHSSMENNPLSKKWVCKKAITYSMRGTLEIAYIHYANRKKKNLPETKKFIERNRPTVGHFHFLWETFTHGEAIN